jgi:hypothetical protein
MYLSRSQLTVTIILIAILISGLVAGIFIVNNRNESQSLESSAAQPATSPDTNNLPAKIPVRGDFSGDGKVDNIDKQIFLQKFETSDPVADLDRSGSVNTLDLALFRNLCGNSCL